MNEKKRKLQMPHTYVIIFFVILFAAVLTMFVPLGQYETKEIFIQMVDHGCSPSDSQNNIDYLLWPWFPPSR